MPKGFVYILECADGTFYTGSTIDLNKRLNEHQNGNGSNHTKKRLPVKLVYVKEFQRIDDAFYKEKQIQGWSRKKKIALIDNNFDDLKKFSECQNDSHYKNVASTSLSHQKSTSLSHQKSTSLSHQEPNPFSKHTKLSKKTGQSEHYFSNGKLLLTAEYVVLDGALALAIPTKYGQSLAVEPINKRKLIWQSIDEKGGVWFKDEFLIDEITTPKLRSVQASKATGHAVSSRLLQILNVAKKLNPEFLNTKHGFCVTTKLDFPRHWGLGTSSTLINNVAQWAKVDAYQLLEDTFGGSGYDIACAQHNKPITYQLFNDGMLKKPLDCTQGDTIKHDKKRNIMEIDFNPLFKNHLYFVYLNQKQNSRDGIAQYKNNTSNISSSISEINSMTQNIISCKTLDDFILLIEKHENTISKIIKQKPVKNSLFNNFNGGVKSLGAWGGDFALVASKEAPIGYFKKNGFETVIPFKDMVL